MSHELNRVVLGITVIVCTGDIARAELAPTEPDPMATAKLAATTLRLSPSYDFAHVRYTTSSDAEVNTWDLQLKGAQPVATGRGYGVAMIAAYRLTQIDPPAMYRDDTLTLHRFEAGLGGGGMLAPGWSLRGFVSAAYASDLEDAAWNALSVTATSDVLYVLGPSDALTGGLLFISNLDPFPVLPTLGWVHQREGSPFRVELTLPLSARAQYQITPRIRGAAGFELIADSWRQRAAQNSVEVRRFGGATFGELELSASRQVRIQLRAGVQVTSYTLASEMAGVTSDEPTRAGGFGQIAVLLVP